MSPVLYWIRWVQECISQSYSLVRRLSIGSSISRFLKSIVNIRSQFQTGVGTFSTLNVLWSKDRFTLELRLFLITRNSKHQEINVSPKNLNGGLQNYNDGIKYRQEMKIISLLSKLILVRSEVCFSIVTTERKFSCTRKSIKDPPTPPLLSLVNG